MVNGRHLYSTFLASGHSKPFTIMPNIHLFMHTFTHRRRSQPCKHVRVNHARVRRLAQGHLDILAFRLGGAGDWTGNLVVTSKPAQPPEPHAVPGKGYTVAAVCSTVALFVQEPCQQFVCTGHKLMHLPVWPPFEQGSGHGAVSKEDEAFKVGEHLVQSQLIPFLCVLPRLQNAVFVGQFH